MVQKSLGTNQAGLNVYERGGLRLSVVRLGAVRLYQFQIEKRLSTDLESST